MRRAKNTAKRSKRAKKNATTRALKYRAERRADKKLKEGDDRP